MKFCTLANLHFLQICVPAFLHAWYGNETIYFHLLKLQGSRFTKVLRVIWWTENSMTLQCVEYRAPFVPAILPGNRKYTRYDGCIARELSIATPGTIHHTPTKFSEH